MLSFNLNAQSWTKQSDFPVGKHHPISFSINGLGYAVTGTAPNNLPTNDVFRYDPKKDSWSILDDFPGSARSFGIGVVNKGKAYIGLGASTTQYLRDFWRYDAETEEWTRLKDCGCAGRRHPAMITVGDYIFVGLGDNANGNLNDWWSYDIKTDNWIRTSNLPGTGRHHPFMFNAGGELYAGLGHAGQTIFKDWYKLDTSDGTWTAVKDFPGEARVAGTQFDLNGTGYVLSGDGDNHSYMPTGEMWSYNSSDDSWKQLTSHPGRSRWAPGSFVIHNAVYLFGGLDRFTRTFPTEMYKFQLEPEPVSTDNLSSININVYPNPANGFVSWNTTEKITEVKIYNIQNQLIVSKTGDISKIETKDLINGLYMVQLYSDGALLTTEKVLVQH